MPDRDYYLRTDANAAALQAKYREHIAAVLKLAGAAREQERAARIYELERRIAGAHVSRTDSADVHKAHNRWTRADFSSKPPGLDWPLFFEAAGLRPQRDLMVWHPRKSCACAGSAPSPPRTARSATRWASCT